MNNLHDHIEHLTQTRHQASPDQWQDRHAPLIETLMCLKKRPNPKVSAVVVGWRSPKDVLSCLDCIRTQSTLSVDDIEIIFVDNGGNQAYLKDIQDRVDVYILAKENLGPSTGRNLGVAYASAPVLAFIDDDGLIASDFFSKGLQHLSHPKIAAVRGRIFSKSHKFYTTLASHYDRGEHVVDDCMITEGAAMIRRSVFMDVGGFLNGQMGHEGVELTFQIKQLDGGWRLIYGPDMIMYHDYMNNLGKFVRKNISYSNIDEQVVRRSDDGLGEFLDAYFSREFKHRKRSLDERVARVGLMAARFALRKYAKLI